MLKKKKKQFENVIIELTKTFTQVCETITKMIHDKLDQQVDIMKSNYIQYKNELSKFYEKTEVNRDTIKQEIYAKLTTSKSTEELQKNISNLMEEITRAKLSDNIANNIESIKQNLLLDSRCLKTQLSCLPLIEKATNKDMSSITKILTDTIDPIFGKLSYLKNRYETLDNFYLPEPNSKIVTDSDDLRMLISWIPNPEHKGIKLVLLYRSSRDGLNDTVFYTKAHVYKPTIGLLDIGNGKICGGFTDQDWKPNNYASKLSNNSFIFSITNKEVYPIKSQKNPIHCEKGYVMSYGDFMGSGTGALTAYIMFLETGSCSGFTSGFFECKGKTAQDLTGTDSFIPKECELYHVQYT